jgi:hypothetical protein
MQLNLTFDSLSQTLKVSPTVLTRAEVKSILTEWLATVEANPALRQATQTDTTTLTFNWGTSVRPEELGSVGNLTFFGSTQPITCQHTCGHSLACNIIQRAISARLTIPRIKPAESLLSNTQRLWNTTRSSHELSWSGLTYEHHLFLLESMRLSGVKFADDREVTVVVKQITPDHELDEEDIGVEGEYTVTIDSDAPISDYADIALDVFASSVAIACLDDFCITTTLGGFALWGNDEHDSYSFSSRGSL